MTMGKEIAPREDKAVVLYELETRFAMACRQRELLEQYIRERLKPEKHFYTIDDEPGRKPSLTKEGAELICLPHALKGHYDWVSGPANPPLDDTPYQITMKCELEANGKFAGEGVGSASSMITKRDGTRVPRQKDPGLRHNSTIKMACKSAYIAATLNSTAASEFFTQDLEDDQSGKQESNTKGHWCTVHKTVFFMKGKMESYAHPIRDGAGKDTGKWCHEPTKRAETPPTGQPLETTSPPEAPEEAPAGEAPQKAPEAPPAVKDTKGSTQLEGIDLDWALEKLKTELKEWKVGAWLHDHYPKVEGHSVRQLVTNMTVDQRKEFAKEVESRLQMV